MTKRGMAKPRGGAVRGRNARGARERSSSDGDLATACMAFVALGKRSVSKSFRDVTVVCAYLNEAEEDSSPLQEKGSSANL